MTAKFLRILFLLLLAIAVWMGWQMAHLPLWGYHPLSLLLCGWLAIMILFRLRQAGDAVKFSYWKLSSIAGVLLGIGFPPYPLAPLYFVAFIPLFLLVEHIIAQNPKGAGRRSFLYLYHAFVLWNIIATFWVANTALVGGMFAIFLNSFFMTIPWLLWIQIRKKSASLWVYCLLPVAWIAFEYGHMQWELSWPWLTLGNAWAALPSWIQWYEYTGVFGGSLWIWALNLILLPLFRQKERLRLARNWIAPGLVFALPLAISLLMYSQQKDLGTPVEFAVVQPNYEPFYQKFSTPPELQLQHFLELSREVLTPQTDFLVLPETSFEQVRLDEFDINPAVFAYRQLLANYPNCALVTGIDAVTVYDTFPSNASNVRTQIQGRDTIFWAATNAAACIDTSDQHQIYRKSRLVPGAEIFPYNGLLSFLDPIVKKLGGSIYGLQMQAERSVFASHGHKVAPVICYESIYGGYVTSYVKAGAQAICIMTNDGWWDLTPGHLQHLQIGRLRAIETRKSIIRAANTGVSCFINQRGDIEDPTEYEQTAVLRKTVLLNDIQTFYTRFGDWIAFICIGLLVFFPLGMIRKKG
ncbi:MAG: apolipoprotein N-acyltransferase [Saprospiraceae bacterium]